MLLSMREMVWLTSNSHHVFKTFLKNATRLSTHSRTIPLFSSMSKPWIVPSVLYSSTGMPKLRSFGVPVELHNTEGTIHGFDIELKSGIVRECVDRRVAFLRNVLKT